jgi:thiamine-phosphate pyrophosphorylase
MDDRSDSSRVPVLHVVTDDRVLATADFIATARALLSAGGPRIALHLRAERAPGSVLFALARELVSDARAAAAWLVVNDRVDIARAAGADGAHLGRRSLPVADARRVLGSAGGIGVSTHAPGEAAEAGRSGASWIFVGTIYASRSHPERAPVGPELVRQATEAAPGVPALAIGGVTPERVGEVRRAGAWGAAVISGVWDAAEPSGAVEEYLAALAEPAGPGKRP